MENENELNDMIIPICLKCIEYIHAMADNATKEDFVKVNHYRIMFDSYYKTLLSLIDNSMKEDGNGNNTK